MNKRAVQKYTARSKAVSQTELLWPIMVSGAFASITAALYLVLLL